MSHLIQLKRRIKSIKTTEKLTHAMRLIAMSLYGRLEKEQVPLNKYNESLEELFRYLVAECPEWKNSIFFPEDILDQNPLFIVISATKGFCGGLNNNLFRYLEYKLHIEEHQKPTFITVGKKATSFVDKKQFGEILVTYHDLNSNNFADISQNIAKMIIEQKKSYSSVTIYSTFFKNFFTQKPESSKIIPFERYSEEEAQEPDLYPPIWEQDNLEITNFIANKYLNTRLTNIFFQSLVSEYASRFVAMDNATTNAEKYLETLTLQFNKLRQSLITREVSELSASL
jgi:F-type H+-transporting ATPase subunit gamma